MLSGAVQILAFGLALLGFLGALVATLLPNWTVSSPPRPGLVSPPPWLMQGLWMDCVSPGAGVFSCSVKPSPLQLPAALQATRAAMLLCCAAAALGLCLAALGLKCTRWGGGRRAKGHTAVAGGGCLVLAAFLCLGPASWFTSEVVVAFLSRPDSRRPQQPGGALGLAFSAAGFLLAGGVILCLSCPGKGSRRPDYASSEDPDRFVLQRGGGRHAAVQLQQPPPPLEEERVPPPKDLRDKYSRQAYV
ncbi:hypothetical protein PBY51_006377 [Eleginops maclovinus]|uniref:Claudin n=1 Tax=Eleginops maclovinus TaxID=56733 RepID=A0AAN8AA63_ELEMC|nr:hypothetical protein PBY51_006377 [Eleginops maclovinus]